MSKGEGIYTLSDRLPFGKHKGKTIDKLIASDMSYLTWCLDKVEGFELDARAQEKYENELDKSREIEPVDDFMKRWS